MKMTMKGDSRENLHKTNCYRGAIQHCMMNTKHGLELNCVGRVSQRNCRPPSCSGVYISRLHCCDINSYVLSMDGNHQVVVVYIFLGYTAVI